MRAKLPARTRIMPHFHGSDEHVTIIKGGAKVGMGEKFDEKATPTLTQGAIMMTAGHRHYFMVTKDTEIQLHGVGPWTITYVNPEDDPSRGAGAWELEGERRPGRLTHGRKAMEGCAEGR